MALEYHRAGWFPIPLQPKDKNPYETGYTGRKNEFPADELATITDWHTRVPSQANIGLWMRDGIIGIDVDDYDGKGGGATFNRLLADLGPLPDTWMSSARADGMSGIRFYKIPKGKEWPGKAGKGIDVVSRNYRYAAVYPSHHPDTGGTYRWYAPGSELNGNPTTLVSEPALINGAYQHSFAEIPEHRLPDPLYLPELPQKWVDHLMLGDHSDRPMDVVSTVPELEEWAKKTLCKGILPRAKWCSTLEKRYKARIQDIKDDPSSHDKVTAAHWEMISFGAEGHHGWQSAINRFETFWTRNAVKRGKRTPNECKREIFRSKYNAIRQLKSKIEVAAADGLNLIAIDCGCFREVETTGEEFQARPAPTGKAHAPNDYRLNDDGNAEHLCDLYPNQLLWVPGYGNWMLWNGDRWLADEDGIARRCYWMVRDRQEAYVTTLYDKVLSAAGDDEAEKAAKAIHREWAAFARSSGTNRGANSALEAAQSIEGVSINAEILDGNERLLGVNNGVLELTNEGVKFRKAAHDDYVTVNTGVDYIHATDLVKKPTHQKGIQLWKDYLDRFIPDLALRRFIQKALGYCLLGSNQERLAIFLYGGTSTGKSTMLNAVMAALGGYAETVDLSIFKEKASGLNPALAQAMPRRIITSSEAGMQNHMHADLFKRMTGNDRISAELKGVNVIVTRIPAFTPIIATNSPPTIKGADSALERRLLILPFNQSVSDSEDEKSASLELGKYAAPIVLNWLAEGWNMYAREGLPRKEWPAAVVTSTKEFNSQLNDIGEFLADAVDEVPLKKAVGAKQEYVTVADMFAAYVRWATDQHVSDKEMYSKNVFGRMLKGVGLTSKVVKIEGAPVRCYVGYKLVATGINVKFITEGK